MEKKKYQNLSAIISYKTSPKEHDQVLRHAKKKGMSLARYLRELVKRDIEQERAW